MKSKALTILVVGIGIGSLALCSKAQTGDTGPFGVKQFSATMVMTSGSHTMTNKVYRSTNKMRTDMGPAGYSLYFFDEHTSYMVMRGHCMQMPQMAKKSTNPFQLGGTVERKALGSDTVDGHPTKIEQVTVTSSDGTSTSMKVWEATDLQGFPVRIEMANNTRVEYKDVSLSEPPASLFEKPDNCMQMPGSGGS